MKLASHDLEKLIERTLEHYDQGTKDFWEGARDHNVGPNIAALQHVEGDPPFSRYSISAAGQGATQRPSPDSATSR